MKLGTILAGAFVLVAAATCVRLGFWQISRLHEKQQLNRELRVALATPPVDVAPDRDDLDAVRGRRVRLRGHSDERHQILLSGRAHNGIPGVDVVTPLVRDGGPAVLVDRGWLYSSDAATAWPQALPEPGEHEVVGIATAPRRGAFGTPIRTIEADSVTLLSARWVDLDSLQARLPYPLAAFVVRELPGPGVPEKPARTPPARYDETMHLSYAIQWFTFAAILLVGPVFLFSSRRRLKLVPRPSR